MIDLQFAAEMFIYLHSIFFWWAPKNLFYLCKSDVSAVQGHPRSLILEPIESAYATSY